MSKLSDSLGLQIARMVERGVDRFDPVRFSYIQSLVKRSSGKKESISRLIERKAHQALDEYLIRFEKSRRETADIVARTATEYPDSGDEIHRCFEQCQFKAVQRMAERLDRSRPQTPLATLTKRLMSPCADNDKNPLTFDDQLRKQEDEIAQSVGNLLTDQWANQNTGNPELRSFHLFKKTWSKIHADNLLAQAVQDRPENPGPLNGQMLATRSLSAMRNLSPSYLDRFVSYFESLLWLEAAGCRHAKDS